MATVFHAYDPRFRRDVAIKVLPREFLHDPAFRARFEREAQTIASLEHPAIVPVYDFGEEDGQPFIVMRLMPNGSLNDRLKNGPLSLEEAARIFSRLAPALDEAHARGIIHRDLKPGNILFDQREEPYLSDFGIAKLTEASGTFTGSAIIGTPAYMSPEQAKGERSIDGRSDLYALGAILFETLTGKLPYEADTPMGIAIKHIVEPVPRILETNPRLPTACETIVSRAMAKDRAERFPNARAMAAMLESVVRTAGATSEASPALIAEGAPAEPATQRATVTPPAAPTLVATPPASPPSSSRPPTSTTPVWMWAGGGLLGVIALGLIGVIGFNLLQQNSPAPTATPTHTLTIPPTLTVSAATRTNAPPTLLPPNTPTATIAPTATLPPPTNTAPPPTATATSGPAARITGIRVSGDQYIVDFTVAGYAYGLPGPHVHFFFDTVAPEQAGVPGAGPWELYGGPSPYTTGNTLKVSSRGAAQSLCILVANANHSVILNTGNCLPLPP